jgi:hypothetical protein
VVGSPTAPSLAAAGADLSSSSPDSLKGLEGLEFCKAQIRIKRTNIRHKGEKSVGSEIGRLEIADLLVAIDIFEGRIAIQPQRSRCCICYGSLNVNSRISSSSLRHKGSGFCHIQ